MAWICYKTSHNLSFWIFRTDVHLKIENKASFQNSTGVHDDSWSNSVFLYCKILRDNRIAYPTLHTLSFLMLRTDIHLKRENEVSIWRRLKYMKTIETSWHEFAPKLRSLVFRIHHFEFSEWMYTLTLKMKCQFKTRLAYITISKTAWHEFVSILLQNVAKSIISIFPKEIFEAKCSLNRTPYDNLSNKYTQTSSSLHEN